MGSQYLADIPSVDFDPAYKQFFEDFYKISDNPEAHEQYANQFTKDGVLVMASKKVQGYDGEISLRNDEIVELRKGMWAKVAKRAHNPIKIFPFGPNSDEVMLYGTVEYESKEGKKSGIEWGARAHLTKKDGPVKMDYYQVYLDTGAQNK